MAFTKPCDQCTNEDSDSCRNFAKCDRYRYWLNYCWKMARAAAKKTNRAEKPTTKWVYHHPDVNRKYIEEGKDLQGKGFDPRKLLAPGCDAIRATVKEKMELFGSVNKA